ncbi:unnamed protein product [Urochloa humidicola]
MPSPQAPHKLPAPKAPIPNLSEIPHIMKTYERTRSPLKKKMPSSSKENEKAEDNLSSEEPIPETYVHGKPFLRYVDLQLGPCELAKFHAWIMKVMKKGIKTITAMIPPEVFHNPNPYQLVIDFDDLHALYRRKHLDVNLVTVWCLMQMLEEEKTKKHRVAFLDPARIHKTEHSFKMSETLKLQLAATKKKNVKANIQAQAHKKERDRVAVYITRVMLKNADKDYICGAYGFANHWIAIIIMPKLAQAVVLDSADFEKNGYKEFAFYKTHTSLIL